MSNVEPLRVPTILESSLQRRGRHVPPIRRARAACTACRARKIRCTSREGEPCANCVFEHVQCMVMPRQRGSKKDVTSRTGRTALESDANTARPCGATIRQAPAADVEHHSSRRYQEPDYLPSAIPKTNIVDTKVSQSESSAIVHQLRSAGPDGAISDAGDGETGWLEAAIKAVPLPRILDASSPPVLQSWPQLGSGASQCSAGFQASPVVPSFLKQPPPGLTEDDLNHLHRRGALSIPEPGLRDALIDSYLLYFHPSHPMLDVDSLYSSVRGDSRQQFSLLVFQAIMFVGSCWVDHKLLRRLGFLSRRAARKAFYWRARRLKLLYDADYEQDEIQQVQALLMMSTWWEGSRGTKDGWHWFSTALSLAYSIGLHREVNTLNSTPKSRALRRCLWWSCIIRDTAVSLAKYRVPLIRSSLYSVSPLTLEDFHLEEQESIDGQSIDPDEEEQRRVATICIHTAGICSIITRVLHAAYDRTSTDNTDNTDTISNSGGNHATRSIDPSARHEIETALQTWWSSAQPQVLHASAPSPPSSLHERVSLVHRAMLSLLYHTGRIIFYRQQNHSLDTQDLVEENSVKSHSVVRDAAIQMNKIIMDAYTADYVKDMPSTFISCLVRASHIHVLETRSQIPHIRQESRRRLEECRQALRELADGHMAAEWVINFLAHVEARVNSRSGPSNHVLTGLSEKTCWPPNPEKVGGMGHEPPPTEIWSQPESSDVDMLSTISPNYGIATDQNPPMAVQMPTAPGPSSSLTPMCTIEDLVNYSPLSDPWLGVLDVPYKLPDTTWLDTELRPMGLG